MPAIIPFIGPVLSLVGQSMAGKQQSKALGKSQASQERLQQQMLEETRPQRELALEQGQFLFGKQKQLLDQTLPLLQQDVLRQPGTSQQFQRSLGQQTTNIMSNLGAFGLEGSSVAGQAVGEATAGLTAQDIENVRNARFRLAGFGGGVAPSFQGGASAGLGLASQLGTNAANLGVQQGAVQAGGTSAVFNTAAQLPLLYSMQQGQSGGGQPLQGGFMAPPQGGNTLSGTDFSSLLKF